MKVLLVIGVIKVAIIAYRLREDTSNKIMKTNERGGYVYKNAFQGRQLVDWLVDSKEMATRQEATEEGRLLLQNDVLRHG